MYTQTYSIQHRLYTIPMIDVQQKKICKNLAEKQEKQIILLKIVEILKNAI
jgi:hypothetical protein